MLTGSGVDEAWATGTQLGEAVIELLRAGKPFTQENLAATYETRRRASWVERGAREAENARNGFQDGIVKGMIGMALAGLTGGKLSLSAHIPSGAQADSPLRFRSPTKACKLKEAEGLAIADGRASTMRCSRRAAGRRFPRRPSAGHAAGRAADGRQGPGDARLCRSRRLPQPGAVHRLRREDLHRHVLRPGHHAGRGRRARLRARKVHPLRRMPVELRPIARRRALEHRVPRRRGGLHSAEN
jgi:hypothetical protein